MDFAFLYQTDKSRSPSKSIFRFFRISKSNLGFSYFDHVMLKFRFIIILQKQAYILRTEATQPVFERKVWSECRNLREAFPEVCAFRMGKKNDSCKSSSSVDSEGRDGFILTMIAACHEVEISVGEYHFKRVSFPSILSWIR